MTKHISLPPTWQPTPLCCPKCHRTLLARFHPNTGALEALRCPACIWAKDFIAAAHERKKRLAAARRRTPPSLARQSDLTRTGEPQNAH